MVQRIHNSLFILRKGMILCVIIAVLAAITGFMMMKPLDLQDKENALQQCYCIAYPVCVMLLYTITFMPFVYSPSRELLHSPQNKMGRNNYSIFIPVFINVCHNIVVVLQDNSLPRKIYSQKSYYNILLLRFILRHSIYSEEHHHSHHFIIYTDHPVS